MSSIKIFISNTIIGSFRVAPDNVSYHGNPAETDTVKEFVRDLKKLDDEAERSQPMSYADCKKVCLTLK